MGFMGIDGRVKIMFISLLWTQSKMSLAKKSCRYANKKRMVITKVPIQQHSTMESGQ